jgi:hypothetical protein
VVFAERLSAGAVVAGLTAGRSYLAESAKVTLSLVARGGEVTAGPGDEVQAPADVAAAVTGAPGTSLVLRTARGVAATARTGADGCGAVRWHASDASARCVRVEVRRPRGRTGMRGAMVAMSNPIWLMER